MAAYKERCADVFGALTLPQGSSLTQTSCLNPEEEYLSSNGAEKKLLDGSLPEEHSRTDSDSGIGDYSDGPARDAIHGGVRRGSHGVSVGGGRCVGSRDGGEDDSRVALVCGEGGRREPPMQVHRSKGGNQCGEGRNRRFRGRGKRTTPDYMVHPQHWTKYDLNEDRASESVYKMSEEQRNTFAALQFLEELRTRKRGGQETNEVSPLEEESSSSGVVFRKPVAPATAQPLEEGVGVVKATWNHARILPEHQVGAKLARKRKPILTSSPPFEEKGKMESIHGSKVSRGVQLHHLCEQSEEDEEQLCDSHMTLDEEPKRAVQDVNRMYDSLNYHEPPQTGCLQLPSQYEGEQQEEGKALFKKSGKRKKQGQRRVTDDDLD